jgi:chemotaxis protein methyltransferase CheR
MAPNPASRGESLVPDGEFPMSWSDFRQIAQLVHAGAGITLPENKVNLVYSRLAKRLRAIGVKTFRDYCALVKSSNGVDERQAMIAALTTNVTRFFREMHHFDHLRQLLPALHDRAKSGERIRFWSAGCSSGEEPYSLALTILDVIPDAAVLDMLILATDIDPNVLAHAERGVYRASQLEDIPVALRRNRLQTLRTQKDMSFRVGEEVRSLVRFRELNLLGSWPMNRKFDAIFCRNVMIYFDDETQHRLCTRYAAALSPGGMLYVGHSERVGSDLPFELVGQTAYRVRQGASA